MVPLMVFSDDTSGNSLPVATNSQLHNIHFVCTSNKAPVMEMAAPLVEEFLSLEKGILKFDAMFNSNVVHVVVAPVICFVTTHVQHRYAAI